MGQTAEEAREQYVALMGEQLGLTYDVLRNDLTLAFAHWKLYHDLYSDPDKLRVLNDVAGSLFWLVQRLLLHGILLEAAKLVDRPVTCGKQNLTLQSLPPLITDVQLRRNVEGLISEACETCDAAVAWRHRLLAHRDRGVALAVHGADLPEVPFDAVDRALQSIAAVLNALEAHFNENATVAYEWIELGGGADSLVHYLQKGLDVERAEVEGL